MIKNGKLFGKINLYDAAILFLLVILLICGMVKFKTFNRVDDTSTLGKIQYTILVKDVRGYTYEALKSGDTVYDSETDISIGTITKVVASDVEIIRSNSKGEIIKTSNPYKNDVTITIETPGIVNENGYYANKTIELKVGSDKRIETKYCQTTGKITSIEYLD